MPIEPLSANEALERHVELVQFDSLGLRFNRATDRFVWHYTNISGLNGILSSQSLWCSDYRYLNDTTELSFGLDILEMVIAYDANHPAIIGDLKRDILMEIALIKRNNMSMFVLTCSFCARGNVLSQWRAYARQDGIAIAFQKDLITELASEQGFTTGMIYYYWSASQRDLPENVRFNGWLQSRFGILIDLLAQLDRAAAAFEQALRDEDETVPFASVQQRGTIIKKWAAETAAFIKHPAFEEEEEWRCVKVVDETVLIGQSRIDLRTSGTRVVPFVSFGLHNQAVRDYAIRQVVIGPNSDGPATAHSTQLLVHKYGLSNVSVAMPFQPLRS